MCDCNGMEFISNRWVFTGQCLCPEDPNRAARDAAFEVRRLWTLGFDSGPGWALAKGRFETVMGGPFNSTADMMATVREVLE